jgi:phytanoyl-CoA hydroxylase
MIATAASLSPAKAFAADGYFIARGLFRSHLPGLEGEFDRICDQLERSGGEINARWQGAASDAVNGPGRVVQHTHNVQCYSAAWAQVWYDRAYLDLAEQFIGPDIVLHHTKLFRKPAERGAAFPMHQDWSYFPTEHDSSIAAIVHVSAATDAMGCLRVHPGSHRHGRLADSGGIGDLGEVQRRFPLDAAVPVECEAGDVVFFHCLTVHGSRINSSDRVRKTVLCQMYAGNDRIEPRHAGHPDARLVLRGWNHRMDRERANA